MDKFLIALIENGFDASIDIVDDIKKHVNSIGNFIVNNPEATMSLLSIVIMLLRASQSLVVSHRTYSERNRIDHTYYDPSTGHHWQLRRKLTNLDRQAITSRKRQGEDVFDILSDIHAI